MTSASSCSISRRVSLIAVSELSSPQPTPTSLSGWSPIAPPVNPAFGLFGSFGFAPANCEIAATAPAMFCWSNAPNAPLHSDMIASLIGVPEPPLRGSTAGCGSGASAGACGAAVGVLFAVSLDAPPPSSSELPQPAATSATTATRSASQNSPRPGCRLACILFTTPPPSLIGPSTDRCRLRRAPLLGDVPGYRSPPADRGPFPEPDQAVRRHEHDDQEDDADQRVEAIADHAHVRRVVVDQHEDERAQPGALQAVEAADDGDHQHVDRRAEADRRRRDLGVPPDEQDPADGGDQA